jgi:N,N'-diacetyllegionaminate synthase
MYFESAAFDFNTRDYTVVIAEIGVNHNGSVETAKQMIAAAAAAGVDIVKLQAFKAEKEISKYAAKAPYQEESTGSQENQLEMVKALELSPRQLKELKTYCGSVGMPFLCTAFDFDSFDFLMEELQLKTVKIPSGEVTNIPFLQYIGSKTRAAVLSTGGSTLVETGIAIESLLNAGVEELLVFHCVSSYPTPHDQANIRAMQTLRQAFGVPVGFSDHTTGIGASIAAAALGAAAVEKHFTLDRTMKGPDHKASIEPAELAAMVEGIRIANRALGSPVKQPAPCELANLALIRKGLVAGSDLSKGTRLTREMIEIKRPEGGIRPGDLDKVVGLTLKADVKADAPIRWEDLM